MHGEIASARPIVCEHIHVFIGHGVYRLCANVKHPLVARLLIPCGFPSVQPQPAERASAVQRGNPRRIKQY